MNREAFAPYTPLLKALFIGLIIGSLITGGLALNAVAITLLLVALLLATHGDLVTVVGVVIGLAIVLIFPQFSLAGLDPVTALLCVALMLLL